MPSQKDTAGVVRPALLAHIHAGRGSSSSKDSPRPAGITEPKSQWTQKNFPPATTHSGAPAPPTAKQSDSKKKRTPELHAHFQSPVGAASLAQIESCRAHCLLKRQETLISSVRSVTVSQAHTFHSGASMHVAEGTGKMCGNKGKIMLTNVHIHHWRPLPWGCQAKQTLCNRRLLVHAQKSRGYKTQLHHKKPPAHFTW